MTEASGGGKTDCSKNLSTVQILQTLSFEPRIMNVQYQSEGNFEVVYVPYHAGEH